MILIVIALPLKLEIYRPPANLTTTRTDSLFSSDEEDLDISIVVSVLT